MSENNNLNDQGFELLSDKKKSDAKLLVFEKRLNFILGVACVTLFGIIMPLFLAYQREVKTNEWAGKELRKPEIIVLIDGRNLENSLVRFDSDKKESKAILIKNIGDESTGSIKIRIYVNFGIDITSDIFWINSFWGSQYDAIDKPKFNTVYEFNKKDFVLPSKNSFAIKMGLSNRHPIKEDMKSVSIMKIYYGEPKPLEIPFMIEIKKNK